MICVDVFFNKWSHGLIVDAKVIIETFKSLTSDVKIDFFKIEMTSKDYSIDNSYIVEERPVKYSKRIAIFIERVPNIINREDYHTTIFFPNPEWLDKNSAASAKSIVDIVCHKTNLSLEILSVSYPNKTHIMTGFTSPDPGVRVRGFDTFAHFRGKSPHRNTEKIAEIWDRRPELPPIYFHEYRLGGIEIPNRWFQNGNIFISRGAFSSNARYFQEISRHGLHLCLSETEGFGHYINEARAMGAVVICIDGAPMNELIKSEFGLLVPSAAKVQVNSGIRYFSKAQDIEIAIDKVIGMPKEQREMMGNLARHYFERDRLQFYKKIKYLIYSVINI